MRVTSLPALLLTGLSLSLPACAPVPTVLPVEAGCETNTPPAIQNLEVNSWLDEEAEQWVFCAAVDWFDPGLDAAGNLGADAPNIFGGIWSVELEGFDTKSSWIDEGPSPGGITIGATSGELERAVCLEDAQFDQQVRFALRLRDSCGGVSNEKTGTYFLGGGGGEPHQVENPEVGGDACNAADYQPCGE